MGLPAMLTELFMPTGSLDRRAGRELGGMEMIDKDAVLDRIWEQKTILVIAIIIVAVVVTVIELIAGSIPVLTKGTVVDKKFVAAHTEIRTSTRTEKNGNEYVVTSIYHTPDKWSIMVEGVKSDGKDHAE